MRKHPCLKQRGSDCDWLTLQTSLFFKMGNYCHKLSWTWCLEVAVNSGKRSQSNPDGAASHANIKKSAELSWITCQTSPKEKMPQVLNSSDCNFLKNFQGPETDLVLVDRLMNTTFALRRKHSIVENPSHPASEILENWPALRMESQVIWSYLRIISGVLNWGPSSKAGNAHCVFVCILLLSIIHFSLH